MLLSCFPPHVSPGPGVPAGGSRQETEGQGRTSSIFSLFLVPEWHPVKKTIYQLPPRALPQTEEEGRACVVGIGMCGLKVGR